MIRLDTGTPGAGKTLINVLDIVHLERANKKNINLNPHIYNSNKTILNKKNLIAELEFLTRKEGQGVDIKDILYHFPPADFECFASTDRIEEYFQKSIFYNEIIDRVNEEYDLKLNKLKPVRTIYTNIAGLDVDAVRPIPPDADWRKLPDGSYVVYDEIQNIPIFSSESKTIDPILKELTIHRHRGFDIIGITQFPDLVHKNFRALVGHHRHLVNSFGLKRSTQYEWSTVKIDPNAFKNKATAEIKSTFAFPKELYKYYRSSTAHTHKRRLPWRFILILSAVLLACATLFTCSFTKDNNVLKEIATGTPHDKAKSNKSTTGAPPTTEQNSASEVQADNESSSISNFDNDNSASVVTYDVSDPFAYQPVYTPEPTNYRVFSGCFCHKKKCKAYDQQGTEIKSINPRICKDLMQDSTQRPFDYFNARGPNQQSSTDDLNKSSTQTFDPNTQAKYEQAKHDGLI